MWTTVTISYFRCYSFCSNHQRHPKSAWAMMFRCSPFVPRSCYEEGVYRFQSIKALTKPDYYVAIPANPKHLIALNEISPEIIHIHSL